MSQGWDRCCQSPEPCAKSLDFGPKIQPQAGKRAWGRLPPPKPFSVPPGEILVQMSDTQRHLNSDLEVVVSIGLGWRVTQESGKHSTKGKGSSSQVPSQGGFPDALSDMTTAPFRYLPGQALLGTFICNVLPQPPAMCRLCPHFTEEETESHRPSHSPEIPERVEEPGERGPLPRRPSHLAPCSPLSRVWPCPLHEKNPPPATHRTNPASSGRNRRSC